MQLSENANKWISVDKPQKESILPGYGHFSNERNSKPDWTRMASSPPPDQEMYELLSGVNLSHNGSVKTKLPERNMSDFNRSELEARLAANKAEVDAIASEMRREMADFRTHYTQQFSSIDKGLSEIKGDMAGIKSSLTTTQWAVGIGLTLVTVVLSVVMLTSSWIISNKNTSATSSTPVIIQVPQQQLPDIKNQDNKK